MSSLEKFWQLGVASALLAACGPAEEPAPKSGDLVKLLGTGQQATDVSTFDAQGNALGVPAEKALLDTPVDVAFTPDGELAIIDWNGHKIRLLAGDGRVYPLLGTGLEGDACEAEPEGGACPALHAEVNHPTDIIWREDGDALIAAWHNAKIKTLDASSGLLSDLCGSGARDYLGDGGPCFDDAGAQLVALDLPSSVALDADGNLFIADQANQVIRRLALDGVLTTVGGSCPKGGFGCPDGVGYAGDGGPATQAKLDNGFGQWVMPAGKLAFGPDGSLYIADTFNHVIRRIAPGEDGVIGSGAPDEELIETFAGTGEEGFAGDGGPALEAQLYRPTDLAFSAAGELFIADRGNHCIRRIDEDGTLTTVAGRCGVPGASGLGGPATQALLDEPFGVAVSPEGALHIADTLNNRILKVLP